MDRSRSKRSYYHDNQHNDYDAAADTGGRPRPRYNNHYANNNGGGGNHRHNNRGRAAPVKAAPPQDATVTTMYRILCHDMKAGGVIGKSGSIIKSIRQHTGAWINVHEVVPGDEERIIEISDTRRRDPDGRMPAFSPAQEALFLIHDRILETEFHGGAAAMDDEEELYGGGNRGGTGVATRLVVSRMHVGSLLGKGGKIIEQMRMETKTQIRVLPRDHNLPRCVSMSEEIVQIVGDPNNVKSAVEIISSRLRESQHRDRNNFHGGRAHSPERFFPPEDDFVPHMNNAGRKSAMDGSGYGSRVSNHNTRNNNYGSRSGYSMDSGPAQMDDNVQPFYGEDLVFRMLCPLDKVGLVLGESDGIIELLQNEIGVDVRATDPVPGAEEQIIIISSEEGPDDELFPAQEALLHIQTRIVDLKPDRDNIITTRLLVSSSDIGCLEGRDGSLIDLRRLTGANIQILSREELPLCVSGNDILLQIVGEIKAARDALVEVTSRLRSYLFRELLQKDSMPLPIPGPASSALDYVNPVRESRTGNVPSIATYQNMHSQPSKDSGVVVSEAIKQNEMERRDDVPTGLNSRIQVTLVTRSILEVVIPEKAVSKLITKSKNMLAQISELSGARVTLVEDSPEVNQKIIQISGTPEQTERAQSLLQGFILSTQDDS